MSVDNAQLHHAYCARTLLPSRPIVRSQAEAYGVAHAHHDLDPDRRLHHRCAPHRTLGLECPPARSAQDPNQCPRGAHDSLDCV